MKTKALLFALPALLAAQHVFAQADAHLKLSDEHPSAGQKITFTYNPAGTAVAGKAAVDASVIYMDGKDYPADDISLKADGKIMKGSLSIPATAKAFLIKIGSDDAVDNNNDKGYIYLVYKGAQPVEGAYAQEGYALFSGMGAALAKIKTDREAGLAMYNKEFALYPQNQTDKSNYISLLMLQKETDKAYKLIAELAASGDEKNMISASTLYKRNKMVTQADSLTAVIKAKFPDGELTKNAAGLAFSMEKDPAKKEALYTEYVKKYPEPNEKKTIHDNFRLQLASAYLAKGDMDNFNRIKATIKDQTNLAGSLNNTAYEWAKKGEHLDDAAQMSKTSLDLTTQKMNSGGMPYYSASAVKKMYQGTYDMYADTYAFILFKQNKAAEAVKIQAPVYERSKGLDAEVSGHYASFLKAAGDYKKATEVIEATVKAGKTSDEMTADLKEMYVKTKGSDKDFDSYYAGLKNTGAQTIRAKLAKEMINKSTPAFALKDLDGNTVSLASLKGKIVIVDFWATWCGPCKASFPGMQLAVNKFKDDPNVKFLFVDCWETADNYVDGVKKFIADNKYTFHVLIDEKTASGKQDKVVSQFDVPGIPTKFIIDASGNIRFKVVGFSGSAGELAEEVSTMIEMAAHPDQATGEKVSYNKTEK